MLIRLKEKSLLIGKGMVWIIGTFAICLATKTTSMCLVWGFYEPEMPKSLYEIEE